MIGDAKSDAVTIAGDKLSSLEMLVKIGNEVPLPGAIKLAYEDLKKKLFRYKLIELYNKLGKIIAMLKYLPIATPSICAPLKCRLPTNESNSFNSFCFYYGS